MARWVAYRPAIQHMLIQERPISCLLFFEGYEAKASRFLRDPVLHNNLSSSKWGALGV
jgi:hypothetical protein